MMRLSLSGFGLLLVSLVAGCAPNSSTALGQDPSALESAQVALEGPIVEVVPETSYSNVSRGLMTFASKFHYVPREITPELAQEAAKHYVEFLDSGKSYFLQNEVQKFYRDMASEGQQQLTRGEIAPAYDLYNLFLARVAERADWISKQLAQPLDLEFGGEYTIDREQREFAGSAQAQDDFWQRRLVSETIDMMLGRNITQAEAQEKLAKRYEGFARRLRQRKTDEVFQSWMNAQLATYGPHTTYFSPRSKEDFDINMSLSLQGIGARLSEIDDLVTIVELIPGGPAELSGQLEPHDKIISVAQGDNGEMVDVVGWRVDDVVDLVRGEKGSVVRLQLETKTGSEKTVRIVRDEINLQEQAAQGEIKQVKNAAGEIFKVGVIELPTFYSDFSSDGERSAAEDTRAELKKLISDGAQGIILDLRDNGGGSLDEAVDVAGLFLPKGSPVVQVQSTDGGKDVHKTRKKPIYKGPLIVLTNRTSASASEIVAGAIQDYGRGLIVGQTTFGKGTVQNLLGLQRFMNTENRGQVKITTAKFYRVSGGSTQHKGVEADIALPSKLDMEEIGESAQDNALEWTQISPALYRKGAVSADIIAKLTSASEQRRREDANFAVLFQELARLDYFKSLKTLPLSLEQRKAIDANEKAEELAIENAWRALEGKEALSELEVLSEAERIIGNKERLDARPDPWLLESLAMMADYIEAIE